MKMSQKFKFTIVLLVPVIAFIVVLKIPVNLGLDLQGGTRLILEAKDTKAVKADNDAVTGAMAVIQNRVDGLGVAEAVIRRKGHKQIVVELPGIKEPDRAIKLVGETALLEFVEAEWAPGDISKLTKEKVAILAGDNARLDKLIEYDSKGKVISEKPIILKKTVLTGADLKMATPETSQYGEPVVNIEFTREGAKEFLEVTSRSVGKPLAILLDGKVISAPSVRETIASGRAQISGGFTIKEMGDLVIKLKAGALPVPVEIISNKTVGPTLGRDSIEKSKKAGAIGLLLVFIFMFLFYRIPGFVANIALLTYLLISMACLKIFNATLTLPGIAGLILTAGMAVDANVIIFERIKEEKKLGQTIKGSIDAGFSKAFHTIFDANITTLIAAVVLILFGTGAIKGFGVTLSIGIIVSMFTAIIITKLLLDGISTLAISKNTIFVENSGDNK
ncbi:MAG: protein translocase subunit SecD [bacterium]|nr:protein translocase subunit SecD [bacterium]